MGQQRVRGKFPCRCEMIAVTARVLWARPCATLWLRACALMCRLPHQLCGGIPRPDGGGAEHGEGARQGGRHTGDAAHQRLPREGKLTPLKDRAQSRHDQCCACQRHGLGNTQQEKALL